MGLDFIFARILVVGLLVYLVYAVIYPEKF